MKWMIRLTPDSWTEDWTAEVYTTDVGVFYVLSLLSSSLCGITLIVSIVKECAVSDWQARILVILFWEL